MTSKKENHQEVIHAMQTVSKAKDVREDVARIMTPYANWEEYLKPAPISISILGELVMISAKQEDFSINKRPPQGGFKYIKFPDSFKACLEQVINEGWDAFSEAHANMDKIRLLSNSIPDLIKLIDEILFQGVETMQAMLPAQLKTLHDVATNCATYASSVKDKFHDLIFLVQELLAACLNAKEQYEQSIKEAEQAMEQAKVREQGAEEAKKLAEEYNKKMGQQLNDIFDQYKQAVNKIPTGWDAVGMSIVKNLANTVINVGVAFANQYAGRRGPSLDQGQPQDTPKPNNASNYSQINSCALSGQLLALAVKIKSMVDGEGGLQRDLIYDEKAGKVKTNWIKDNFATLQNKLSTEEPSKVQEKAQSICNKGIAICEKLEKTAASTDVDKKNEKAIVDDILELHKEAMSFDSYSKSLINSPTLNVTPPHVAKSQNELGESEGVENSYFVVQQNRMALEATQKAYQESFDRFKKQNDELTQIFAEMKKSEMEKIDFEKAQEMLVKGLKALGYVKQQWEKMVLFFQMVSNLIDTCLNQNIEQFLSTAEQVTKIANYSAKSFIIDLVYNQGFTASIVAHLVNMIAEAYCEISSKYLMEPVRNLGTLLEIDASDPAFPSERKKLLDGCELAQKAMYDFLVKKKDDFDKNLQARADNIEETLKSVLPPVSEETKKAIEEATKQGTKEALDEIPPRDEDQFI